MAVDIGACPCAFVFIRRIKSTLLAQCFIPCVLAADSNSYTNIFKRIVAPSLSYAMRISIFDLIADRISWKFSTNLICSTRIAGAIRVGRWEGFCLCRVAFWIHLKALLKSLCQNSWGCSLFRNFSAVLLGPTRDGDDDDLLH